MTTNTDQKEYWLLKHSDGRHIIIARRDAEFGSGLVKWIEAKDGNDLRQGAWDLGMFSSGKPGGEIASLLERFRGEGYELISIRTPLSATALKLLRDLDRLDDGDGVADEQVRNGWRLPGGGVYSHRTFQKLDGIGLIDPGNGFTDRVKILPVGRDLARYTQRRRAQAGADHA